MKILHLDIETSPNIGPHWGLWQQNIGYNMVIQHSRILCMAFKWHGKKGVEFLSEWEDGTEAMLKRTHELLSEADAVVHYNGQRFDIPWINTEFLLHGLTPPDPFHQIDLLKVVKNRFKFVSNKLDFVADRLEIGTKVKHTGMQLWLDVMAYCPKAQKLMKKYNIQDVALLEDAYNIILPWIKSHPNHALFKKTDAPVCPNCGSSHVVKNGTETTLTMAYQRYRCQSCGTPIRGRTTILPKEKRANVLTQSKI